MYSAARLIDRLSKFGNFFFFEFVFHIASSTKATVPMEEETRFSQHIAAFAKISLKQQQHCMDIAKINKSAVSGLKIFLE